MYRVENKTSKEDIRISLKKVLQAKDTSCPSTCKTYYLIAFSLQLNNHHSEKESLNGSVKIIASIPEIFNPILA